MKGLKAYFAVLILLLLVVCSFAEDSQEDQDEDYDQDYEQHYADQYEHHYEHLYDSPFDHQYQQADQKNDQQQQAKSVLDALKESESTSLLSKLLSESEYAPIVDFLQSGSNFTIFAPNRDAIQDHLYRVVGGDKGMISALLQYHIVNGTYKASTLNDTILFPPTLLNSSKYVRLPNNGSQVVGLLKNSSTLMVNYGLGTAHVVKADMEVRNGVVHVIDRVMWIPQNISAMVWEAGLESGIGYSLNRANLTAEVERMEGATVFMPIDEAFSEFAATHAANHSSNATSANNSTARLSLNDTATLTQILKYHILSSPHNSTARLPYYSSSLKNGTYVTSQGGNITVEVRDDGNVRLRDGANNTANIVRFDVLTSNGVVHFIDRVLVPPVGSGQGGAGQRSAGAILSVTTAVCMGLFMMAFSALL
ncbi:uncharacterized protein VTP21DRAFT_6816 [Calcarisporiella thermophila]|uniref:uncharacterized protein n=1 Tax=Calcarisporiella thermophila TaxID=911321 RepID=UPI00374356AB